MTNLARIAIEDHEFVRMRAFKVPKRHFSRANVGRKLPQFNNRPFVCREEREREREREKERERGRGREREREREGAREREGNSLTLRFIDAPCSRVLALLASDGELANILAAN